MRKVDKTADEYIASLPEDTRMAMSLLDKEISKIMAGKSRVLWQGTFWGGTEQNIIGYGDVVYERPSGNVEWFIAGLASQKNYISVYINAVEDNQYLAEKYVKKLGRVKVGKSSISFKKIEDIELEVLLELIAKAKKLMG